jgi:AcrR family transcriptional regulator
MSARPRLSGQRRRQILEAAAEVIADRGLCDTRVTDVARRAGTSAALVIYYFETKDRLLTEALTFADDRFYLQAFHELTALDHPRDQLVRLIEMSSPSEPDVAADWTLWVELWARARRDQETARKREALDRRWRATIADIVREGQRSGEFLPVDADQFALRLTAVIDGLSVQVLLGDSEVTAEHMRETCLEMASSELGFESRGRVPVPTEVGGPVAAVEEARGRRARA